jgi:hypothetical protein
MQRFNLPVILRVTIYNKKIQLSNLCFFYKSQKETTRLSRWIIIFASNLKKVIMINEIHVELLLVSLTGSILLTDNIYVSNEFILA